MNERFFVVDFGGQTMQLIARRVRELGCYAEIVMPDALEARLSEAKGVIFSGGPWSVYEDGAPTLPASLYERLYSSGTPMLGICYGMQLTAHAMGGEVAPAAEREFGPATLHIPDAASSPLLAGLGPDMAVWMSHGDRVERLPEGFEAIAHTPSAPSAIVRHVKYPVYGVQFHPEVTHTPRGTDLLRNFLFGVCGASGDWSMANFVEEAVAKIQAQVGDDERVICGLSGGVDSTVAAVLIHKAIGDRLTCIFVDNGLLRKGERDYVESAFREHFHIELRVIDAGDRFLSSLEGVTDPELKRKHIGRDFVEVFTEEARTVENAKWLAQGTLYPDVIESQSAFGGKSQTIKTHHNVGGLPEKLGFKLLEPFRELFKDEVRAIGRELDVPEHFVERQPFPGPGLAVRIAGAITRDDLATLRDADHIVTSEIEAAGAHKTLWQYFAVLIPVKTVGVMGDGRTYEQVIAVRAVESTDAMTADWADLPRALLAKISNRIINDVRGVNRVVYDISTKPPSTIEWE